MVKITKLVNKYPSVQHHNRLCALAESEILTCVGDILILQQNKMIKPQSGYSSTSAIKEEKYFVRFVLNI